MQYSKRKFLKQSLAGVASVAAMSGMSLYAKSAASAISKSAQEIGIGIIGVGSRGTGLASVIDGVAGIKVKAICDTLDFRLEDAKNYIAHSDYVTYKDYRKLLDDNTVQAVLITSPFSLHAEMALAAIAANKAVYCEKTLAYGIAETQALVKAVKKSGVIFQTGHQHRNSPLTQRVKQYVQEGYLGKVIKVESQWNRNGDWRRKVHDPALERQLNWRMYREYSGGLAAELSSHQIDFVNWLTNSHPVRVMGMGGIDYWKDGRETYDNVNILTEYASGLKASYTSLTSNGKDNRKITILGDKGSIVLNAHDAYIYSEILPENIDAKVVDGVSGATMKAWQQQKGVRIDEDGKDSSAYALAAFRDAILSNTQPISTVESGALTSIVVQMALDAMDSGNTQTWSKDYDLNV